MLHQIAQFLPTLLIQLVLAFAFTLSAWLLIRKTVPQWTIPLSTPLILAGLVATYSFATTLIQVYQHQILSDSQVQKKNAEEKLITYDELKQEFLNTIDVLSNNPSLVTPETKAELFRHYAPLFLSGDRDKANYKTAISQYYECQKAFFQDALNSIRTQQTVKSPERAHCETLPGDFFHREKLLTDVQIAENNRTISILSGETPAKDNEGNPIQIDVAPIEAGLASQVRRLEAIKQLFE